MSQHKKHSAYEAATNTLAGFGLSWLTTYFVLPYWGYVPSLSVAAEITAFYAVLSFVRSYAIRRLFNA